MKIIINNFFILSLLTFASVASHAMQESRTRIIINWLQKNEGWHDTKKIKKELIEMNVSVENLGAVLQNVRKLHEDEVENFEIKNRTYEYRHQDYSNMPHELKTINEPKNKVKRKRPKRSNKSSHEMKKGGEIKKIKIIDDDMDDHNDIDLKNVVAGLRSREARYVQDDLNVPSNNSFPTDKELNQNIQKTIKDYKLTGKLNRYNFEKFPLIVESNNIIKVDVFETPYLDEMVILYEDKLIN